MGLWRKILRGSCTFSSSSLNFLNPLPAGVLSSFHLRPGIHLNKTGFSCDLRDQEPHVLMGCKTKE